MNNLIQRPWRKVTIGIVLHQESDGSVHWEQHSNHVGDAAMSPAMKQALMDWWEAFDAFGRKYQQNRVPRLPALPGLE